MSVRVPDVSARKRLPGRPMKDQSGCLKHLARISGGSLTWIRAGSFCGCGLSACGIRGDRREKALCLCGDHKGFCI